ncbi:phosphatidylglycerophosphatase A family protein [Aquisalibacillus elongatus]|uniref:Phosphatidylglycerophosphatase A n=1 Tax=Aquisalibacillus elongatus TaxID=485577 RepID=A0A3N5B408_9BACI|nr:phosphatidylglycerophosphatase A [Aquisalibacillus elongatus]RPF52134.1 phosphatidylglycerophosphatase A [Aquisalibacillus elongatus]
MSLKHIRSQEVELAARQRLEERGVSVEDIADIVYIMQGPYNDTLTMDDCVDSVEKVLEKREIQHAILVGIELDVLAEKEQLSEPLQSLIAQDEGLFGVDETIALGAALGYGSIAVTTYGHLDKQKVGVIQYLDTKSGEKCHTFLDDIVGSIAANASSRIAHRFRDKVDGLTKEAIEKRDEEDLM